MAFERLRYKTDQHSLKNKRPAAFMFTYGSLSMRIARSQFSRNFFACAGFETIDNHGFKTVEEGIKAAMDSKAEIVVICSADEEYPVIAPQIYEGLKDQAIVAVAGYPKDIIEELRAKGIEHFIHVRSNILEELEKFLGMTGVK
jgi:methylmalonyl-CoA mutase